ncbi:glyoxalase [Burkholderia diffusa]|uniref:glyoxalase n=1 Tax=Burkholderia diffusa TaxID=488732 RepID=UPI001FC8A4A6|nr:glyoxalase [Burkholderia diffusa]
MFEARNPVTRVAYLHDADDPGMRDSIARGIAEARARDGADPVRIIDASTAA